MVWKDEEARDQITDILRQQGYGTYARLFRLFDFYFTDDDNVIAYMIPQKAAIVVNEKIKGEKMVSVLVRHEILHEYFTHYERELEYDKSYSGKLPSNKSRLSNIAGDFDISNRGYTDEDKYTVRNIKLGDKLLSGLVTEDHHKDWLNLSFEEMYEKLLKEKAEDESEAKNMIDQFKDLDQETLDKLSKQIDDLLDQMNQQEDKDNQENDGQGKQSDENEEDTSKKPNGSISSNEEGKEEKDSKESQKAEGQLEKAKDELDKLGQKLDKLDNDGKPFDTDSELKTRKDIRTKVKEITDAFKEIKKNNKLIREVDANIEKERISKIERERNLRSSSGLERFKVSLNRFIKNEVNDIEEVSYSRLKAQYLKHDVYLPSETIVEGPIPLINVYHDVSGSFSDPAKTEGALKAIDTLREYVRKGQIKIRLYYVTEQVYDSEHKPNGGSGANGEAIIQHVKATKPDNVIVITDSDANSCDSSVTVPGAVWLLFYDATAPSLITNLRGRKENRYYMIDYR